MEVNTITYKFADGTTQVVEVSDELYAAVAELEHATELNERRETRRHILLDRVMECKHTDIVDKHMDLEADFIKREHLETLHTAVAALLPEQRKLLRKVFFEKRELKAIAEEYGMSYQGVQCRLNAIIKRLRKSFAE